MQPAALPTRALRAAACLVALALSLMAPALAPLLAQPAPTPDAATVPITLTDLALHRDLWPRRVTLKVPVQMNILSNGTIAGVITSPEGTQVNLSTVDAQGLHVAVLSAQAVISPDQTTDLWPQVAALAARAHVSTATTSTSPLKPAVSSSPSFQSQPPIRPPLTPIASGIDASTAGPDLQFETEIEPRDNFDKAAFRFWSPAYKNPLRGLILLVPGSNGDGRGMTDDRNWRALAQKYRLALVGVFLQSRGSDYCQASNGSGDALFSALKKFAAQSSHPEVATAPLALYGESAGGQFDYDFVLWKPERVICFVVNKGGYYNLEGSNAPARADPGLFILGLTDADYRVSAINGIWAEGRGHGALWALARQPNSGHEFSRTADLARTFFEPVLKSRLPDDSLSGDDPPPLKTLDESSGWLGDLTTFHIHDASADSDPDRNAAWLPDQTTALAWQKFVTP